MARGDYPRQADDRSISAIETQLTGKDISLDAKRNIDLEAGWNRQSALNHTTQKGLSVGVEASVGTSGVGFSLSASGQMQWTNMENHQAVADMVLNAANSVSLTSGGRTTLKEEGSNSCPGSLMIEYSINGIEEMETFKNAPIQK